jgi:hypothetical protein
MPRLAGINDSHAATHANQVQGGAEACGASSYDYNVYHGFNGGFGERAIDTKQPEDRSRTRWQQVHLGDHGLIP